MFCTKCGKELYDGDRFCAHCGAEVREAKRARYDDVVFNPPFRMEAQRRTEEILRSAEKENAAVSKKETVAFDWNLDGFPSTQPRKTEAVDFNWDSVLERKNGSRQIKVEKIEPEQEFFFSPPRDTAGDTKEVPAVKERGTDIFVPAGIPEVAELMEEPVKEEVPMTIEELERELFGFSEEAAEEPAEQEPAAKAEPAEEAPLFGAVSEPTIIAAELFSAAKGPEPEVEATIPEADAYQKTDEKFYTYNQKFGAFQELLEKEREKLKAMEDSYSKDLENMDYTWVGEVFPELTRPAAEEPKAPEVVAIVAPSLTMAVEADKVNEALEEKAEDVQEVVTETPAEPAEASEPVEASETVEAAEPAESAEEELEVSAEPETSAEDSTPSKTKLRYSDVFPRDLVDSDGTGPADTAETKAEVESISVAAAAAQTKTAPETKTKTTIGSIYDDIDEYDEPKKHTFAKIIITILLILIVAEGIIIGAKFLAPDSKISLWANDMMLKVVGMVMGGDEEPADDEEEGKDALFTNAEKDAYMDSLIAGASAEMTTIGEATYTPELTFDTLESYSFEEIPEAEAFVDADWYEDSDGTYVTYGDKMMEALIRYYDSWQAVNTDESLVGINSLEFGEIKTGKEGFYVLCKVTYAGADGGEVEEYHTVYLRISDKAMIINEIKEDNL